MYIRFFLPKSQLFYSLEQCVTLHIFSSMSVNTGISSTKIAGHHIKIVGIDANDHGCSCSKHRNCGAIVTEGTIIRLALVHFTVGDVEEKAIAAIEVKGGCRVGFA